MVLKTIAFKSPKFDKNTAILQEIYDIDEFNYCKIYRDDYGNKLEIHCELILEKIEAQLKSKKKEQEFLK